MNKLTNLQSSHVERKQDIPANCLHLLEMCMGPSSVMQPQLSHMSEPMQDQENHPGEPSPDSQLTESKTNK